MPDNTQAQRNGKSNKIIKLDFISLLSKWDERDIESISLSITISICSVNIAQIKWLEVDEKSPLTPKL